VNPPVKRWVKVLVGLFVTVDLIIAIVLFGAYWNNFRYQRIREDAVDQLTDAVTAEENPQVRHTQTLGEMHRLVTLSSEPEVKDGQVKIMLSNSEESLFAVRMTLMRLDTQEIIAATQLVDPGWRVENLPLNTHLPSGTYFCLATMEFVDPAEGGVLGTTARQVLLAVP